MKTRVLFANLPWWDASGKNLRRGVRAGSRWPFTVVSGFAPDHFVVGSYCPYPYFMGCAAAWVWKYLSDATVVLRDSVARGESYDSFNGFWQEYIPTHVILETSAASWEHDLRYVDAMKKSVAGVKVAVAGPATMDLWRKHGANSPVDAWILGEYEKGALRFCTGVDGLIGFDFLSNEEMNFRQPRPWYDEAVWHHYYDSNPRGTQWPEITIWASRGCWFRCQFCAFPASMTNDDPDGKGKRKIRFYNSAWLLDAITDRVTRAIAEGKHPVKTVRFDGDTENAGDMRTLGVCEVMRQIKLPWSMMCRADTISRGTWAEMKAAGCFGVKIGFESGSQRIVNDVIGKQLDIEEAADTCQYIQSLGINVHGTFALGSPTETEEEKQMTLRFIQRLYRARAITTHQLSGIAELPNTPLAASRLVDPNYVQSSDGQKKIEEITK